MVLEEQIIELIEKWDEEFYEIDEYYGVLAPADHKRAFVKAAHDAFNAFFNALRESGLIADYRIQMKSVGCITKYKSAFSKRGDLTCDINIPYTYEEVTNA